MATASLDEVSAFRPETDSVTDLGGSSYYWANGYIDRLYVTNTTVVTNLNADTVDGRHIIGAGYSDITCAASGQYDTSINWALSSTPSYAVITAVDTNDGRITGMELYGKNHFHSRIFIPE